MLRLGQLMSAYAAAINVCIFLSKYNHYLGLVHDIFSYLCNVTELVLYQCICWTFRTGLDAENPRSDIRKTTLFLPLF